MTKRETIIGSVINALDFYALTDRVADDVMYQLNVDELTTEEVDFIENEVAERISFI